MDGYQSKDVSVARELINAGQRPKIDNDNVINNPDDGKDPFAIFNNKGRSSSNDRGRVANKAIESIERRVQEMIETMKRN